MNYGELKAAIIDYSHRTDLDGKIPGFIATTSQRLGRRFGVMPSPLVADTDTNSLLKVHPYIYVYGALRELMIYTQDAPSAGAYDALYRAEVEEMNINYRGLDWDACDGPVMRSERQAAIIEESL